MWTPWSRSKSWAHPLSRVPRQFTSSCSSFKDVQTLCSLDDSQPNNDNITNKSPSIFRRIRVSTALIGSWVHRTTTLSSPLPASQSHITLPDGHQGIVVYYTSLRVVRKTFDDCRAVISILRGFRVLMDERDVSMDQRFLEELQEMLGRKEVKLPRVFIGGRYIGGVEDIGDLFESGELQKLIERLPAAADGEGCELCGGLKFLVCEVCDGSHKLYREKTGFRSCVVCNLNGLVRCPSCSYVLPRNTR